MIKSDSIGNLSAALIVAKKKFAPVLKQKENPAFKRNGKVSKYADLEGALDATEGPLMESGLVVSQFPVNEGDRVGVLTLLIHISGEYIGNHFTLPLAKQDAQTGVAAVTYARRASYMAVLSIAAEDDDGNAAAGRQTQVVDDDIEPAYTYSPEDSNLKNSIPLAEPNTAVEVSVPTNDGVVPNEAELDKYRTVFSELTKDLSDSGALKASRGMSAAKKVLVYLLQTTGAQKVEQISTTQWKSVVEFIDKMKAADGGLVELGKLINDAAKEKNNENKSQ